MVMLLMLKKMLVSLCVSCILFIVPTVLADAGESNSHITVKILEEVELTDNNYVESITVDRSGNIGILLHQGRFLVYTPYGEFIYGLHIIPDNGSVDFVLFENTDELVIQPARIGTHTYNVRLNEASPIKGVFTDVECREKSREMHRTKEIETQNGTVYKWEDGIFSDKIIAVTEGSSTVILDHKQSFSAWLSVILLVLLFTSIPIAAIIVITVAVKKSNSQTK